MKHADRTIQRNIASLRRRITLIRFTPALWPLWWPVLCACEVEVARLERALEGCSTAHIDTAARGELIDLDEWRRRKAKPTVRRRQSAGDAA